MLTASPSFEWSSQTVIKRLRLRSTTASAKRNLLSSAVSGCRSHVLLVRDALYSLWSLHHLEPDIGRAERKLEHDAIIVLLAQRHKSKVPSPTMAGTTVNCTQGSYIGCVRGVQKAS